MASSSTMDAADEAGGETVFSSDGMAPLPIPKVPEIVQSQKEDSVYEILETDNTPLALNTRKESPEERLQRLTKEVEALQQEFKDNEQVSKLARDLSSRLAISSSTNAQEELMRAIQQRNTGVSNNEESGVVYELYGGATIPSVNTGSVEERLLQMERLVGASSTLSSNSATSILTRMEQVENLANRVDEKALEEASTRAKVIRADLEAASKARTKLSGAAVSANDAKTISELYAQLKQLEGIGHHLPALSARLQQLASLHSQSATFANRLSGIEQELPQLQATLQQLQSSLTNVEDGMMENLKTVEQNIKVLETKMEK